MDNPGTCPQVFAPWLILVFILRDLHMTDPSVLQQLIPVLRGS